MPPTSRPCSGRSPKPYAQLGGLDILVNNAGVLAVADIAEFTDEAFERMLAVNVRGVN